MCPKNIGFRLKCPCCQIFFFICAACYRGHRYCSPACSKLARSESKRASNRRYAKSELALKRQRLRQNRYRKKMLTLNKVTEQTSAITPLPLKIIIPILDNHQTWVHESAPTGKCFCCGLEVKFIIALEYIKFWRSDGYRFRVKKQN